MSSCIDAADRQRYAGQIKRLGGQVASDSDPHFTHFLTLSGGALCRLACCCMHRCDGLLVCSSFGQSSLLHSADCCMNASRHYTCHDHCAAVILLLLLLLLLVNAAAARQC